ncbi:MAG TPA: type II secretion system F family protein [Methanoregulaceae archaeon]|nr:type II secretion system F family protein [Methanoregulaceae archaeon]
MTLREYIRSSVRKDPVRYNNLHSDMLSARMGMTVGEYILRSLIISCLCGFLLGLTGYLFGGLIPGLLQGGHGGVYNIFNLQVPETISPVSGFYLQAVLAVIFFAAGTYAAYALLMRLPSLRKKNRAVRINMSLHNAVAYMYAMRRGGAQLTVIFRSLSDNSRIYGEIALEFRQIVRDTDFFGYDIVSSIRHLSDKTPSEKLKDFLEDLLSVIESGGNMTEFLGLRVRLYQDDARFEQKQFLSLLSIIAESYVTVFVAGPLFLIIIMVVMGMISSGAILQLTLITYAIIPIGSLVFILLLDLISEKGEKTERFIRSKVLNEYSDVRIEQRDGEETLFAQLAKFDRLRNIVNYIRHPFESFVRDADHTLYITVPIALVYIIATLFVTPRYTDIELLIDVIDDHLIVALLIILIPYAVFYALWARKVLGIEALIPDFLGRMAGINQVGLTIAQAITIMVNTNLGLLSYEIRRIKKDMEWGANFSEALMRFEERVSTPSIARTVTLITKASEMSGQIGEVLTIASSDAKMSEILKKERRSEMFIYTGIVYLSFFVFLFVVAVLMTQFLPVLANISLNSFEGAAGPLANIGTVPVITFGRLLYHTCLIQALFSGLIAGQMGEGSIGAGVKHSCVLLIISLVTFNYII